MAFARKLLLPFGVFNRFDMRHIYTYYVYMKNITLVVDERILKKVRKVALDRDTTVNAMVREYFIRLTRQDEEKEKARRRILEMIGTFDCEIGHMPTREERNDRR